MNELQAQLDAVNAQIAEEQAKGPQKDADVLAGLEQKQAVILMNMDEAKTQEEQENAKQVRIQEQEVKVENEPIPIAVAGLDLTKLDPDLIQLLEIVTKADRRARLVEFNAEVETIQNDFKEQLKQANEREQLWKQKHDELNNVHTAFVNAHDGIVSELQKENTQLKLDKQDAESKRDAAVSEKEGIDLLYKNAQEEIQHMRTANVFGEKNAQNIIPITPEETNKAQNLVDSLVKKFVSTTPIGGNWHEVVDEAGNKMVVHAKELQKLEEVQPFRLNTEVDQTNVEQSTTAQAVKAPAIAEVAAPVTFPVQSGDPVAPGAPTTDGQGAVTRAEFEALKAIVKECAHVCDVDIAEVA